MFGTGTFVNRGKPMEPPSHISHVLPGDANAEPRETPMSLAQDEWGIDSMGDYWTCSDASDSVPIVRICFHKRGGSSVFDKRGAETFTLVKRLPAGTKVTIET